MCLKIAGWVANKVDPDETPRSVASNPGLHCLLKPVCTNMYGIYGIVDLFIFIIFFKRRGQAFIVFTNIFGHFKFNGHTLYIFRHVRQGRQLLWLLVYWPAHQTKVREKTRECHKHKPQPFQDTKRKRNPTKPNKHKSNKRTKSTKISSLFPKRGNRNTKRTEKYKITQDKTSEKPHLKRGLLWKERIYSLNLLPQGANSFL